MSEPVAAADGGVALLFESPPFELDDQVQLLLVVRCRQTPDGARCCEPLAAIVATTSGTQWLPLDPAAADAAAFGIVDNELPVSELVRRTAAVAEAEAGARSVALYRAEWSRGDDKTPARRVAVGRVTWVGSAARFEPDPTD